MMFPSLSTFALALAASSTAVQALPGQVQDADLTLREDGKCKISIDQFKDSKSEPAYLNGEAQGKNGKNVGTYYKVPFRGGGYPTVLRGFPEYLLITKKEKSDDTTPIEFQYLAQKWESDDKKCEQKDYVGNSRKITCSFDC
ncbi:hypothetical protein F4779DRAFT_595033 [Xylariaceae sp. FL0662B]|nr:hypothetical protein F4779DRAFT_595033 [Xylariaceae sp. FL0662B]